jgi:hypothetical protein
MRLTEQQIETLKKFEKNFETAIRSKYAIYPGLNGVKAIHEIYSSVVKNAPRLNTSCSTCIFNLLVQCGEIYFKDKQELEKSQEVKPKRTRKK